MPTISYPGPYVRVQVNAYSGYRANERPMAFVWDNRRYEVDIILDRWYQGGLSPRDQKLDFFKVLTKDGGEFILRYDALFDAWSIRVTDQASS
ncbi:MAG: hypothetical protein HQK55_14615 [Deltaproteobacteria bacterium]|nr:hypothetical protein [Deltaproteobacteria bacterium]